MGGQMYRWMDGGQVGNGCVGGWMNDEWVDRWVDGWLDGRGWLAGWMGRQMDEWMMDG